MDHAQAKEDFEQFLILMGDQLEWLEDEAAARGIELNLGLDTEALDRLEHLFDVLAAGKSADDVRGLVVAFARYLGEWVRLRYGGQWFLPLDDPRNVYFNTPVIVGHSPVDGLLFSPIFAMKAYSLRRRPGLLWSAVESDVNPTRLDLSGLQEEP